MLTSFCIGLFISLLQIRFMEFSFFKSAGSFESEGCVTNTAKMRRKRFVGKYLRQNDQQHQRPGCCGSFPRTLSWLTTFDFVISTSRDTCNVVGQGFFS